MRPKLVDRDPRPGHPAARHVPLLRADRVGQDDHALRGAARDRPVPEEHHHRRRPDRISPRQHHPDGDQHQGGPDVRRQPAVDPPPGPRRHHDRRDPRPGDRQDRLPGGHHRAHGLLDRARQRHRHRAVPPARPGRRAVLDRLGAVGRARPAPGPRALRELQGAVQAQARVPQEGQPPRRQGRRLLPPPDRTRAGLPQCGGTGYLGRTGIFELLVITEADARHDPRKPLDQQPSRPKPERTG